MAKFENGQKVKVLKDAMTAGYYHGFEIGQIVTVEGVETSYPDGIVRFHCRATSGTRQLIRESDLAPVFQPGTKVALKDELEAVSRFGTFELVKRVPDRDGTKHGNAWRHTHDMGWLGENQLKWVADPAAHSFKTGDIVKLVSGGMDFPLYGYENGEVYEVLNPDFFHSTKQMKTIQIGVIGKDGVSGYATPDQLEAAQLGDASELGVGDVIKIVEKRMFATYGKEYTITEIDSYGDAIFEDNDGDEAEAKDYEFIVVSKAPKVEPAPAVEEGSEDLKLKKGDVIRFTYANESYVTVGKLYTVINDEGEITDDDGANITAMYWGRRAVLVDQPAVAGKVMFLANGSLEDTIAGKLYEIIEDDRSVDGTVLIIDEDGDRQWVDEDEGKFVRVTDL